MPPVLRGSLITMRRRCGKPTCRCADGTALHESAALSVSLSGRSVTVSLRTAEVPAVAAALARYQSARDALEAQASAGVAALREAVLRLRAVIANATSTSTGNGTSSRNYAATISTATKNSILQPNLGSLQESHTLRLPRCRRPRTRSAGPSRPRRAGTPTRASATPSGPRSPIPHDCRERARGLNRQRQPGAHRNATPPLPDCQLLTC